MPYKHAVIQYALWRYGQVTV